MDRILKISKIAFAFLVFLFFNSCSPSYLKGYNKLENSDLAEPQIFTGNFTKATYKCGMSVMGNELSGILLVKKTRTGEFRFVFVSEIGMKYFDLGIASEGNQQTVYYLMPLLDRGGLVKIFFDDFEKLIPESVGMPPVFYREDGSGKIGLQYKMTNAPATYFLNTETKKPDEIKWKSKQAGKSEITISSYSKTAPSHIKITNKKYGVAMTMEKLHSMRKYQSPIPQNCQQAILVVTESDTSNRGVMHYFERKSSADNWERLPEEVAVSIGRNGLAWGRGLHTTDAPDSFPIKKEGDGKSPAGVFYLNTVFGYKTEAEWGNFKMPYLRLTEMVECVDDASSESYNSLVSKDTVKVDWNSSEKMSSMGVYYELGVTVDHNKFPIEIGAGSCIFLHNWKIPFGVTAGCTAMAPENMKRTAFWLDAEKIPVLIQLTKGQYKEFKEKWQLPAFE